MRKRKRIPLETRLQAAAGMKKDGWPVPACSLFLDTYFYTLSYMTGDMRYRDFYIRMEKDQSCGDVGNIFLAQEMVEALAGTYGPRSERMLYEILVGPFTDKRISRWKGGNAQWNRT